MTSNVWKKRIIALALFAAVPLQIQLAAQNKQSENQKHHHYKLIDVGTFGGPNTNFVSQGVGAQVLNSRRMLTGSADTSIPDPNAPNCLSPDCFISHAFQWRKGSLTDLGALPGVNSSFGSWITANGLVAGLSGNGEIDPLTGGPELRAVLWNHGAIIDLGTFGGNESLTNAANSRGQVVGSAANAISDPFNTPPFLYGWGTQMHAFLWASGAKQDLGTLGGPDSVGMYVNEAGQVAGFSYISYTPDPGTGVPPTHPFLWENGIMHDLGTTGGAQVWDLDGLNSHGQVIGAIGSADEATSSPFLWDGKKLIDIGTFGGPHGNANWLNEAGEVVGHAQYSNLCPGAGQGPIDHAYLWKHGTMTDLGTVPGINPLEGVSSAWGINSETQIVGNSATCDYSIFVAFLWENGSMVDLNTLIPPNSAMHVELPVYISDRGEITGQGTTTNGDAHTFLLIPCDDNHPGIEGCDYSLAARAATESTLPVTDQPTIAVPHSGRHPSTQRPRRLGMQNGVEDGNRQQRIDSPSLSGDPHSLVGTSDWVERLEPEKHAMQDFDTLTSSPGSCSPQNCLIRRCLVRNGKLSGGYCLEGARGGICHESYDPADCPSGKQAKRSVQKQCGQSNFTVDDLRPCQ